MEVIKMKLIKLQIEKLYDHYNYENIIFNPDVTFIYGLNGCGKTTVLNITEAIITGQIFKLFEYPFKKIVLQYAPKNDMGSIQEISIDSNETNLNVVFKQKQYDIESNLKIDIDSRRGERSNIEKARYYYNKYPFLLEIKKIFNYVYLPLNRSSNVHDFENEEDHYILRQIRNRQFYADDLLNEPNNKDIAMIQIENLINVSYNRINSNITRISDSFRNDILKSLLDVNTQYIDSENLIDEIFSQQANINSIRQTRNDYIKILKELSLIDKEEEDYYTEFFNSLFDDIQNKEKISISSLLKFNEISRIKRLVALAKATEKQKSIERKPIELFLKTMNDFINTGEDKKKIEINPMGQVYFTTKHSETPINIQYLSSGEKQLITFFANLIFKVKSDTSGIFVVDEPELSLHLSWQNIFVKKTLEVNENIQLVFATHSPEIIGKYRKKMFVLEKEYVDKGVGADE